MIDRGEGCKELSFIPLGVGDAFSRRYYSSCLFIEYDNCRLLVDCPHPIRKMMFEAGQSVGRRIDLDLLDGVLITHLHGDHISGVEGTGFYSRFVLDKTVHLIAHANVFRDLWPRHLQSAMAPLCNPINARREFADFFDTTVLGDNEVSRFGPFSIECRKTIHHVSTTALKIRAGKKTLGVSADTAFDETLIDWFADTDMFVHETNVGTHTPYENLAALPESVRNRMRLIHYPDDFDKKNSKIEPLEQGVLYIV